MATAAVHSQPHGRTDHGPQPLRFANYPEVSPPPKAEPGDVAAQWVESFNKAILAQDHDQIATLFLKDSCWRDQLALSWDFHSLYGPEKIATFLKSSPSRVNSVKVDTDKPGHAPMIAPVDFNGKVNGVLSYLHVDTDVGRGPGIVRLLQDSNGTWKVYTLFTSMIELKGHEETVRSNRPLGVEHGGHPGRKNWQERRDAVENFEGGLEPTVLIIGAGQGGLTSAARLHQLGVPSLIIDRNPRVGDNWRNRYHQLVLHDPVWYDHLPYMPFPDNWPVFTPKDKLAEWFECYVRIMELNVWTSTSLKKAKWDGGQRQWTIELERQKADGTVENRVLHPRHVVQATGHSGEMSFPKIQGLDEFKGDVLCHSSQFRGARENSQGKKAIVVGCCNSGHDIAQDYYEHGYDVTMVQRSSTSVITSKTMLDVFLSALYREDGPETEDSDLLFISIPNPMLKRMHLEATEEVMKRDATLRAGLDKAGFKVDNGPDEAGFFMKYFQRGGGYYIDVGASQLIVDGKIKIKQGQEVSEVLPHGLAFADGTQLDADEIIFATGYQNMRGTARKIFGDETADQVKDVWGFDDEGELRTMYRRTGHPGFWFFGGNLALCRYYSRMLALQIKAMEEGIMKYEDP